MRIAERQEQAQRLIAIVAAQEIDRAIDHRPIAIEPFAASGRFQPALEEAIEVVAAGVAAPGQVAAVGTGAPFLAPAPVVFRARAKVHVAVFRVAELPRHQIVLAAPPHQVAVFAQHLQQVRFAGVGMQHVMHGAMAAHMRIPAGHERAAAWRADRGLREGVAEGHGVLRHEFVQIRRSHRGMAEVAQGIAAPLIGVEEDDVGFVGHRLVPLPAVIASLQRRAASPNGRRVVRHGKRVSIYDTVVLRIPALLPFPLQPTGTVRQSAPRQDSHHGDLEIMGCTSKGNYQVGH